MTNLGKNALVHVAREWRERWRDLCEGVLRLDRQAELEDMDVYRFSDGGSLGVVFRDPAALPSLELYKNAVWLEFEVDDLDGAVAQLIALDMPPLEHFERSHPYFRGPGGPIFRLAPKT